MSAENNNHGGDSATNLSQDFRKLTVAERRSQIHALVDIDVGLGHSENLVELADAMVESAVGYLALPLGIATGFLIDGEKIDIPMATEEPSVIAAATYAAKVTARAGGITTTAGSPITTGQVFLESCSAAAISRVKESHDKIGAAMRPMISSMEQRGGGLRGIEAYLLPETGLLCVEFHLDVCDAMGANIVNTVGEAIQPVLETVTGGRSLMAIVTNAATQRVFGATVRIPVRQLLRAGIDGSEVARRIVLAGAVAGENRNRAVTHNKGIMNGVTALALATGNDTRAVEAAAHNYASRSGHYVGLTTYKMDDGHLIGHLEMPIVLGSVGGAAEVHPTSKTSRAILGDPGAVKLSRIAAALGLAQNFAALYALVSEGIQTGHMALHARRLAQGADSEDGH